MCGLTFKMLTEHCLHACEFVDCAISPTGAVSVNEGADQSFDITVNSGVIQFLEVDGALEACNQFGCSYTFNNVAADHTLDVLCN